MDERLVHELRRRWPHLAARAEKSPRSAIVLFCCECMGGDAKLAVACAATECPLHAFRPRHGIRPPTGRSPANSFQERR